MDQITYGQHVDYDDFEAVYGFIKYLNQAFNNKASDNQHLIIKHESEVNPKINKYCLMVGEASFIEVWNAKILVDNFQDLVLYTLQDPVKYKG